MDDDELEQAMRAGLQRRAERADLAVPVVERARRAARERRTTRWAVVGVAAVSVAVIAVGGVVLAGNDSAGVAGVTANAPTSTTTLTDGLASGDDLRTEYWEGLQVQVPADWTWGSTPGVCGAPPVGEPYVGRPIGYTDVCGPADPDAVPTAPYVWLDADVPNGTVDLGDGWTRETIGVDGVRLTVAAQDDDLRSQIIESAASQHLCAASLDVVPESRFETTREGYGAFIDGRLCAYRSSNGGPYSLSYAKTLDEATVDSTLRSVDDAPEVAGDLDCYDSEQVVVGGAYHDNFGAPDARLDHRVVYGLSCGIRSVSPDRSVGGAPAIKQVSEATVKPWATAEFKHLLVGPSQQWAYRYFIGVQG